VLLARACLGREAGVELLWETGRLELAVGETVAVPFWRKEGAGSVKWMVCDFSSVDDPPPQAARANEARTAEPMPGTAPSADTRVLNSSCRDRDGTVGRWLSVA
jgi:hypothetical protein